MSMGPSIRALSFATGASVGVGVEGLVFSSASSIAAALAATAANMEILVDESMTPSMVVLAVVGSGSIVGSVGMLGKHGRRAFVGR